MRIGGFKRFNENVENLFSVKLLGKDSGELIVYALIAIYTILFSYFTIINHYAFRTYAWDLGIFNQALWTTLNKGMLFFHTLELFMIPSGSFFGVHFSPLLFMVLPLYALYQSPETLLVFQSFILAFGSLPVYWLARDELQSKSVAVMLAIAYLFYPPLHGVNWFDFHVQSLLPAFLLFALHYLRRGKWVRYFTFTALALMVEEQVSITIAFIGIYILWEYRRMIVNAIKKKSLTNKVCFVPFITIIVAFSWLFFAKELKNTFFPISPEFYREYTAILSWQVLGIEGDPLLMPIHILLQPWKAIEALSYDWPFKYLYLVMLFGPVIFLPLRSGFSFTMLSWLGPALLSNNTGYYRLGLQYPAYIVPLIFMATIFGIRKIANVSVANRTAIDLSKIILVVTLLSFTYASPLSPLLIPFKTDYRPAEVTYHEELLSQIIKLIPPEASVLTQNNIFPHVSNRLNVYAVYVHGIWEPTREKIFKYTDELTKNVEYILVDLKSDHKTIEFALYRGQRGDYGVYASADGILLLKRGYKDAPVLFLPIFEVYDYRLLKLGSGDHLEDPASRSGKVLQHLRKDGPADTFWFGPYVPLPPGKYEVVFRLKAGSLGEGHVLTIDVAFDRGEKILSAHDIQLSEFTQAGVWQNFTISFTVEKPISDIEFRGLRVSNTTDIFLDYIEVKQTGMG